MKTNVKQENWKNSQGNGHTTRYQASDGQKKENTGDDIHFDVMTGATPTTQLSFGILTTERKK